MVAVTLKPFITTEMKIITVGLHRKKVRIFGAGALLEHAQSSNETFEGEWDCEGV